MPCLDTAIAQSAGPMTTIVSPVAPTLVTTTWNSLDHLEIFLDHYRKLGVARVLAMDFDSTDGTAKVLSDRVRHEAFSLKFPDADRMQDLIRQRRR